MVSPNWERIGFGVARNSQQFFYVTQNFAGRDYSLSPLTDAEYIDIKNQIINHIIRNLGFAQSENFALSNVLSDWQSFT